MAELTPQVVSHDGLDPTYASATAAGDEVVNDGRTILHVKNDSVDTDCEVTVDSRVNSNQGVDTDVVVNIPFGEERFIGPFKSARFNLNDKLAITYDSDDGVTIAALRLGDPG